MGTLIGVYLVIAFAIGLTALGLHAPIGAAVVCALAGGWIVAFMIFGIILRKVKKGK